MNKNNHEEITSIYDRVWQLSPQFNDPLVYKSLLDLTADLINAYKGNGRLDENPFSTTMDRTLSLPEAEIQLLLKSKVCLVTGGLGCVGALLVKKLLSLGVKKVVVLDKKQVSENPFQDDRVQIINVDIADRETVINCFKNTQPSMVFHTAAQRNPGAAELSVQQTITDNVVGSLNIAEACELSGSVKQCVFSSTGKASRYYTKEVYAASKKMCEFIFDHFARKSHILYSMVRFTHILDNSLMHNELKTTADINFLPVHSPGKYVTAQNATEAIYLMLNALTYAQPKKSIFVIVRNLEWPVESLEVALYYLQKRSKAIPVIFKGNPPGYREHFFRGQLDWSKPHDLNLLINVYENRGSYLNTEEDIIISSVLPVADEIIMRRLAEISSLKSDIDAKEWLFNTLYECVSSSLKQVDDADTLKILQWGLDPNHLNHEKSEAESFEGIINLLIESIKDNPTRENANQLRAEFEHADIY